MSHRKTVKRTIKMYVPTGTNNIELTVNVIIGDDWHRSPEYNNFKVLIMSSDNMNLGELMKTEEYVRLEEIAPAGKLNRIFNPLIWAGRGGDPLSEIKEIGRTRLVLYRNIGEKSTEIIADLFGMKSSNLVG